MACHKGGNTHLRRRPGGKRTKIKMKKRTKMTTIPSTAFTKQPLGWNEKNSPFGFEVMLRYAEPKGGRNMGEVGFLVVRSATASSQAAVSQYHGNTIRCESWSA